MFEEILHLEVNGINAKFTIRNHSIDGETFYYSHVINTDLDSYKSLSDSEKQQYVGMTISDGKGNKINYRSVERLKEDIRSKYGTEWLESEI